MLNNNRKFFIYLFREKRPFCTSCFEGKFAEVCNTCSSAIGLDEGQMQYRGFHWHATDKVKNRLDSTTSFNLLFQAKVCRAVRH